MCCLIFLLSAYSILNCMDAHGVYAASIQKRQTQAQTQIEFNVDTGGLLNLASNLQGLANNFLNKVRQSGQFEAYGQNQGGFGRPHGRPPGHNGFGPPGHNGFGPPGQQHFGPPAQYQFGPPGQSQFMQPGFGGQQGYPPHHPPHHHGGHHGGFGPPGHSGWHDFRPPTGGRPERPPPGGPPSEFGPPPSEGNQGHPGTQEPNKNSGQVQQDHKDRNVISGYIDGDFPVILLDEENEIRR